MFSQPSQCLCKVLEKFYKDRLTKQLTLSCLTSITWRRPFDICCKYCGTVIDLRTIRTRLNFANLLFQTQNSIRWILKIYDPLLWVRIWRKITNLNPLTLFQTKNQTHFWQKDGPSSPRKISEKPVEQILPNCYSGPKLCKNN